MGRSASLRHASLRSSTHDPGCPRHTGCSGSLLKPVGKQIRTCHRIVSYEDETNFQHKKINSVRGSAHDVSLVHSRDAISALVGRVLECISSDAF